MALPSFLQPYLASYNLSKLDIEKDKKLIITEILNKGDSQALKWLTRHYSKKDIKSTIELPIRGSWLKPTLDYWLKIFGIKKSDKTYNEAIINLNP